MEASVVSSLLRVVEIDHWTTRPAGRFLVGVGADVTVLLRDDHGLDRAALAHWHAGKRIVTVRPDDDIVSYCAGADVVLRGASGGDVLSGNLLTERLRSASPDVVDVALSPFGADGPRSGWEADELTIQAASGLMTMTGHVGEPPIPFPSEQATHIGGINASIAALLGFLSRQAGGTGQHADISIQECATATTDILTPAWIYEQISYGRLGERHPLVPHGLFDAADGVVAGGLGGSPKMWDATVTWMAEHGAAGELTDERWSDPAERMAHRDVWERLLGKFIAGFTRDDFVAQAQARHLPWAPIVRPDELIDDAQMHAREFFASVDVDGTSCRNVGFAAGSLAQPRPLQFDTTPSHDVPDREPQHRPQTSRAGALSGVRVLDLTWVLAGPYATRILGDHGAEVIKVESVHRPDPTRFSPNLRYSPVDSTHHDDSGYFSTWNRNKKSIALNLRSPDGLDVLRRLIAESDVVIDNFSAGVMDRWGLGYDALRELRDDIIWVSMSGMGQTGPNARYVAYADIVAGFAGITAGIADDDGAVGTYFGYADMIAGYHAALHTVAALATQTTTGRGQHVDLSQVEAMASQIGPVVLRGQLGDAAPAGLRHVIAASADPDVWLAVSFGDDHLGELRQVCGLNEGEEVDDAIHRWAATMEADSAAQTLQKFGIPAAGVATAPMLVDRDPQLAHREFFVPVTHERLGTHLQDRSPIRLSADQPAIPTGGPLLGADTDAVLCNVAGLDAEAIAALREAGTFE